MLAAEIASTTAKPSMILERNRRVGSLNDKPLRFWNRTLPPVFVLKIRHRGPNPNALRKLKAEWIKVRKYGQKRQGGSYPPLEGSETSEARSWVDAHAMRGGVG